MDSPGLPIADIVGESLDCMAEGYSSSAAETQLTSSGLRGRIEIYVWPPAGDFHRATLLIHKAASNFIGPYRVWSSHISNRATNCVPL